MNVWNPIGHIGRNADFVLFLKTMLKGPDDCKRYQDQMELRQPMGEKSKFLFSPPLYQNTQWDKMTDVQKVKFSYKMVSAAASSLYNCCNCQIQGPCGYNSCNHA